MIFVASLLVPAASAGTRAPVQTSSERSLVSAVNQVRSAHQLQPLRVDVKLVRVARAYSATMLQRNVFTHGAMGTRLARAGVHGPIFGENLAWGTGSYASARSIVESWLRSPGHRKNLLRPGWTRIGIGIRTGTFLGHGGASVITADFAGS